MTTKRIVSQLLLCLLSLHQSKTFKMFSFMFCSEFSNMEKHTLYQRYKYPSLSFSIFSSKLLILHEFKLFLILYAKCKCNITTSKEDKPPYQYNTRCTRGPSSQPQPHQPTPLSPSDDEWMPTCWGFISACQYYQSIFLFACCIS